MLPPAPDRRTGKRQRTADHLTQVAFTLFEIHGYDTVTMEQIAREADVAKGTLYNHFPVKEALVVHRMHSDLAKALPSLSALFPPDADCGERLRLFFRESARYTVSTRDYLPHYLRYRMSQPHSPSGANRSGLDKIYSRLLAEGQEADEIDRHLPAQVLADMLGYLHFSVLMRWLSTPDLDLGTAFEQMLELFLNGCATGRKG